MWHLRRRRPSSRNPVPVKFTLTFAPGLNVLSGTTWKGARLRIGEAKPDFIDRHFPCLARERRLVLWLAHDSAWPARAPNAHAALRPLPPEPTPPSGARKLAQATALLKKKKKRDAAVLVRARRRMIDPEAWGTEYLKGVTLESTSGRTLPEKPARKMDPTPTFSASDSEETIDGDKGQRQPSETQSVKAPRLRTQGAGRPKGAARCPPTRLTTKTKTKTKAGVAGSTARSALGGALALPDARLEAVPSRGGEECETAKRWWAGLNSDL
ncbi:hypothetical protein DFH11DRAFT_1544278 [Phellopilus nigrolimitatus]|nr:hypothetical protein DFH11DRAFT_1544278 [Phellopilus nigrolimitatus]